MPIRPDLRHHYRGPAWRETRARILARAAHRCEQCGAKNGESLARFGGYWWHCKMICWITPFNTEYEGKDFGRIGLRMVRIVLTVAHLNHVPGDDRDENLKALCQWCHLNYDKLHHAETRSTRKDGARPLLAEGATTCGKREMGVR